MSRLTAWKENKWMWKVVGLLLFGAALRFVFLGDLPMGLNQDEASAGYEAWALLHSGMDRCGNSWPVLFESWGSGQNVLYSYLSMPWIGLFGLNVWSIRLTAALCGTLSILLLYDLATNLFDQRCGWWAAVFLAVCPWHIMASRWALESNLLPFFLLLGTVCLVRGITRPVFLLGAAVSYALCFYAYGTAFFFLPLFLIPMGLLFLRHRCLPLWWTLSAAALFALIAAPIVVCQIRNALGLPETQWGILTLPQLTEGRQMATSVFGGGSVLENLASFFRVLIYGDGYSYNALPGIGLFYPFGLLLALAGIVILGVRKGKTWFSVWVVAAWLVCAIICGALISGNVNRLNFAMLPVVLLAGVTLAEAGKILHRWGSPMVSALLAVSVLVFLIQYGQQGRSFQNFYADLEPVLEQAEETEADTILVTNQINMPYIFVLFYRQIPPEEFVDTVVYWDDHAAFRWVQQFGKWRFGDDPQPGECYLSFGENGWNLAFYPKNE